METLTALGFCPGVLDAHKLNNGITAARPPLPRCWFDAVKCARDLEALPHHSTE